VAGEEQRAWFDAQLRAHHYLGAGRPVGDYLRQIVTVRGRPAALLVWGPACYALKDRDEWIGRAATLRVERLKLVVQNRRFLLQTDKGAAPNLASQTMAAALRALPAHWQVPSYSVFYDVLTRLDADAFATLLLGWLQAYAGQLPSALALDGKMIRDHLGVLSLFDHDDGAP